MRLHSLPLFGLLLQSYSSLVGATSSEDPDIKSVPLRTHSLAAPYLDSDLQSRWFDWGGDTIIRADQYIRLTSDRPHQQGWLFSRLPLTATNWEVEVEFKINGANTLYGDGLAMWITKERATPGPVFGSKDNFEGLGIFFDTYKNNRPGVVFPYVMAMIGDGKTRYDQENDGKANELGGCSARGIRSAAGPTKARLTYFQEKSLTLSLLYKDNQKWENCFEIPNIKLPQVAYLGFSAECGELSDSHDIISVEAKNLYSTAPPDGKQKPMNAGSARRKSSARQGGGWGWFFIKGVFFIVLVIGGYIGYTAWRAQQRTRF